LRMKESDLFVKYVDDSVFTKDDWVSALKAVNFWLEENSKGATEENKLSYIACTAEYAASSQAFVDLAEVVREFLNSKGFDAAN
jgi:hypothetical protein